MHANGFCEVGITEATPILLYMQHVAASICTCSHICITCICIITIICLIYKYLLSYMISSQW